MLNKTRVITAIFMGIVFIPFFFFGGYFIYALASAFAFLGTYELVKMHNSKNNLPSIFNIIVPILSAVLVLTTMVSDLIISINGVNYIVFCILVIIVALLVSTLVYKELKVTDGFYYIGSIFYAGASFAVIAALRNASVYSSVNDLVIGPFKVNVIGLAILGYVLSITLLTDIGAYEIGCRIGKHKLIPDVSPNKSVEGAIGGSVCGSILGTVELVLCESLLGFNLFGIKNLAIEIIVVFLLSLCLTIVSQIGDLIASKLKREYGIKDYSNLFPGHGGIMDRFDSLILTSALFFVILALFGVVLC